MLDENLPTFVVNASSDRQRSDSTTINYTQHGSELSPAYTLRKPDPSLPGSKNRYAVALYDAFNPEILFAEVLLVPEWTQPTLSAEAVRNNGGVPPPPEPILPSQFTIQLYNPDQQVVVRQKKPGTFTSTPTWYFDLPQQTFRQPSASALDRTQNDPVASDITPKIGFKWKKDSKLSKDLACFASGKTMNPDGSKKKSKEPDITVAIFSHLREITLYEPNLQRIEIEDPKGLEVVLLLGAMAIRDVYFGRMTDTFNISDPPRPSITAMSNGTSDVHNHPSQPATRPALNNANAHKPTTSPPRNSNAMSTRPPRVPPTDPRSQWEIDAESARLRRQAETEEHERQRREAAEQKQIKKMLEAEEKEERRRQADIDKETERLKRIYGKEQRQAQERLQVQKPHTPPRHSAPTVPTIHEHNRLSPPITTTTTAAAESSSSLPFSRPNPLHTRPHSSLSFAPPPHSYQPYPGGPFLPQPAASGSSSHLNHPKLKEKKSFFGFGVGRERGNSAGGSGIGTGTAGDARLLKKKSSMF